MLRRFALKVHLSLVVVLEVSWICPPSTSFGHRLQLGTMAKSLRFWHCVVNVKFSTKMATSGVRNTAVCCCERGIARNMGKCAWELGQI